MLSSTEDLGLQDLVTETEEQSSSLLALKRIMWSYFLKVWIDFKVASKIFPGLTVGSSSKEKK